MLDIEIYMLFIVLCYMSLYSIARLYYIILYDILDWTGLDWTGLDWTRLYQTRLDQTRLDQTRLDQTRLYGAHEMLCWHTASPYIISQLFDVVACSGKAYFRYFVDTLPLATRNQLLWVLKGSPEKPARLRNIFGVRGRFYVAVYYIYIYIYI